MPIHEFFCSNCQSIVEVLLKANDPAPCACHTCGKDELKKIVSKTSFKLKGGGWYSDLYSSNKPKKEVCKDAK